MTTVADVMDFTYNFVDSTSHNNGNVQSISNNRDWRRTQSFTYDSLSRISTAQTSATNQPAYSGDTGSIAACWAETYAYDAWGNIVTLGPNTTTQPNYVGCTQESGFNYTGAIAANNRIAETGFTYDAAGNMTVSPGAAYVYDAENHLLSAGGVTYSYDGDGKRVMKSSGTLYWYGTSSDAFMETDLSNNMKSNYFFFNGQRVASENTSNQINWYFADHLGSSRVVWSLNGTDDSDYYPFGAERVISTGAGNHYKFTGKERDSESGLDNFGARYDNSSFGRFMSPDIGAFHFGNPQSLNRYAYALNNPLFYVDPDGEESISAVYHLGNASLTTYIESGQSFDDAAFLASFAGPSLVPLGNLDQNQSIVSGGSGAFSKYIPSPSAGGGGCVLGCSTTFNEVPVGISLSLSFSYDDKTGEVTGANIERLKDTTATFIGPNPSAQVTAFQPLPGVTPIAKFVSVRVNTTVIGKLSPGQLSALFSAAGKQPNAIRDAIRQAIIQEQQRRAEEQRKKEEAERQKQCQQGGSTGCA